MTGRERHVRLMTKKGEVSPATMMTESLSTLMTERERPATLIEEDVTTSDGLR